MSYLRFAGVVLFASLVLSGCGGDGDGGTGPIFSTPSSVTGVSGNNQTGVAGQALAQPIRVRVLDTAGRGVANVTVQFNVASGGGTITAAVADGLAGGEYRLQASLLVDVTTNSAGEAQATWLLGTGAGGQTATATVMGLTPFTFAATAQPDVPASLSDEAGDDQVGFINQALDEPFVVRVTDRYGNAVPGAAVVWQILAGNGELTEISPSTDANGFASARLVPGPIAEPVDVMASLNPLAPVTFFALGFAGVGDVIGDTYETAASDGLVAPDLTALAAWREAGNLVVVLGFADIVNSDDVGGPNTVFGIIDFDSDQNAATGDTPGTDAFRPGAGSTNMGRDFYVSLSMGGTGMYSIIETSGFTVTGTVVPEFFGDGFALTIPLTMLGNDDGVVNMATVVGTQPEPTDISPEDGNLATGPAPGPVSAAGLRATVKRKWGERLHR